MRKLSITLLLLLAFYSNTKAQNTPVAESTSELLSDLKKAANDSARLTILTKLGSYYLYKPGEDRGDLDSADVFLDQAKDLSAKLKITKIQNEVSYLKAEVLFERGDQLKARVAYLGAIENYILSGDKAGAAHIWLSVAGRTMSLTDSSGMRGLHAIEHALTIYTELNDKEKEAEVHKFIGDQLFQQGKLDDAENEVLQALSLYKSAGYAKLHYTYDLLVMINTSKGNFDKALYYSNEMIKSIQATSDTTQAFDLYSTIAVLYKHLKEYDKAKYWYNKALASGAKSEQLFYTVNNYLIGDMIKDGKTKEGLEYLLQLEKKRPPTNYEDRFTIATRLAECYSIQKEDGSAEIYYKKTIGLARKTLWKYNSLLAYRRAGEFYFSRNKYGSAAICFQKAAAISSRISEVEMLKDTYLELFKTDSAMGNYLSAIKDYQQYKSLTDSIFTVAKTKQITQLQLQFEKDQKVQQLEDKGKLQQAELQHAGTVRNFSIAGAGLLLLLLCMGYRRYRQKQHSNRLLRAQQHEISLINQSLELTIAEKESLLTEKESLLTEKDALLIEKGWLLKEVHHRVKNNLHTVLCLLESQESGLENDALEAIEICQRRIYAMSLIHQKLYQSEDIEMVDMGLYIKEFTHYLAESFGPPVNIKIRHMVGPTKLDISQAIPLGLIINEAVTNAFKYAFPGDKHGEIFISLKQTGKNVELVIADNGIGIRRRIDEAEQDSLGIDLMRGLTRDLKGTVIFNTDSGTSIVVQFTVNSLGEARKKGINSKHRPKIYDR
jgi:two-component sensor histidine kinase